MNKVEDPLEELHVGARFHVQVLPDVLAQPVKVPQTVEILVLENLFLFILPLTPFFVYQMVFVPAQEQVPLRNQSALEVDLLLNFLEVLVLLHLGRRLSLVILETEHHQIPGRVFQIFLNQVGSGDVHTSAHFRQIQFPVGNRNEAEVVFVKESHSRVILVFAVHVPVQQFVQHLQWILRVQLGHPNFVEKQHVQRFVFDLGPFERVLDPRVGALIRALIVEFPAVTR